MESGAQEIITHGEEVCLLESDGLAAGGLRGNLSFQKAMVRLELGQRLVSCQKDEEEVRVVFVVGGFYKM